MKALQKGIIDRSEFETELFVFAGSPEMIDRKKSEKKKTAQVSTSIETCWRY